MACALLASTAAMAQTYEGTVVSTDEAPVPGTSVILLSGQKKPVSFARADADGKFAVTTPAGKEGRWLAFIALGFRRDTVSAEGFKSGDRHVMHEKVTEIREVKVAAGRIFQRGDTLNFLTSMFKQGQDRTIEDVLREIPGISVGNGGEIKWQGKSINKFYIEGMDLLGDKYTIASRNISADKVQKVQVMENHEPVKLLRDVSFSDQAALNIVLSDDAKNTWQCSARLGAGSSIERDPSLLGDARLMAMLFAHHMQSVTMYKYNNTGDDILHEVNVEEYFGAGVPTESGLLSNISLGTPDIKEQRTRFNNSHALATNWLFKLTDDSEIRLQASGARDKSRQQQRTETFYNDIDGGVSITEDQEVHSYEKTIDAELKYQLNSDHDYLTNTVKGLLDYSHSDGRSVLNGAEVDEYVRPHRRYVTEKLDWTHRAEGGRAYSVNGYASVSYLPGNLLLHDDQSESLTFRSTFWGGSTYYRHRAGRIHMTYTLDNKGQRQHMDCESPLARSSDKYTQSKTSLTAMANYKSLTWELEAAVPVAWLRRTLDGESRDDALVEPSARVKFTPDAYWTFTTFYRYGWNPLSLTQAGESTVFTSYITMSQGLGRMGMTKSHNASADINYKNAPKGLFGRVSYYLASRPDGILYDADYADGFYVSRATGRRASAVDHILSCCFTRSIPWWRANFSLFGDYSHSLYSLLIAGEAAPFAIQSGGAGVKISVQPRRWLSVDIKSTCDASKQHNRDNHAEDGSTLSSFAHTLKLYFMPGHWQMEWGHELYHSSDDGIPTCYFSDLSVSYRQKKYEVGLTLSNILGVDDYRQRYVTPTQRVFQVNELRPREILAKVSFDL